MKYEKTLVIPPQLLEMERAIGNQPAFTARTGARCTIRFGVIPVNSQFRIMVEERTDSQTGESTIFSLHPYGSAYRKCIPKEFHPQIKWM